MSVDVVVAVPARDEEAVIEDCLRSVIAALRQARRAGSVDRGLVAVAVHRSRDRTEQRARTVLADVGDLDTLVWPTEASCSVGALRTALINRCRPSGSADRDTPDDRADRRWVFSTDADTVVPVDWITRGLRLADGRHRALVGLVDLDLRRTDPLVRARHAALVSAGVEPDGTHRHVYAANLAVRADAFAAVGGFPDIAPGEEHGLVAALRAAGHPVRSTREWSVITSGRLRGRAADGLSAVLAQLADEAVVDGTVVDEAFAGSAAAGTGTGGGGPT